MQTVECPTCKIVFGVSVSFYADRVDTGEDFYCPAGHVLCYTPTRNQLLEKVEWLEKDRDGWRKQWYDLHDDSSQQGRDLTKAKLRAAGYKSQWLRVKYELEDLLKAYAEAKGVERP
jgi:hypothetical protein